MRRWTEIIMLASLLAMLAVEIVAMTNAERGDTISDWMRSVNRKTGGLVALGIAALWIHWFVPLPRFWR
jgi:hypothetical protein